MKKVKPSLIAASLLLVVSVPSYAKEGEWKIQLEPMYMGVFGDDVHAGDRMMAEYVGGGYDNIYIDPINLEMDSGLTLRGELEYMKDQ